MTKLSDLLGTVTIDVPIGEHTVTVTYRLAERTIDAGGNMGSENVAESAVRLVESWDLEADEGGMLPLTVEALRGVPIPVLARIVRAIVEDVGLGEASSSSDAG